MGHSYEYEHLGADVPDAKPPTRIRVSGDIEVRPWPPLPYDFMEMAATAGREEPAKPTLRQRIRAALRLPS